MAEKLTRSGFNSSWIKDFEKHIFGTERFLNSVKEVSIDNDKTYESLIEAKQDIEILHKYFPNLTAINLTLIHQRQSQSMILVEHLIEIAQVPLMNCVLSQFSNNSHKNMIDSRNGWMLVLLPESEFFINYKHLKLDISRLNCSEEGDYIRILGTLYDLNFIPEGFSKAWNAYDNVNSEDIQSPTMFLHKKFIQEFEIDAKLYKTKIVPTRKIKLKLRDNSSGCMKDFIPYIERDLTRSIDAEIELNFYKPSAPDFAKLIELVFNNLRVTSIQSIRWNKQLNSATCKNKVLEWQSLKRVKIPLLEWSENFLDIIEKSSYVKQWVLESNDFDYLCGLRQRLKLILNEKEPNSVICNFERHNLRRLQVSQTFEVNPI